MFCIHRQPHAYLLSWSPAVVQLLVQLCSNIFGKGIVLHSAANSRISGQYQVTQCKPILSALHLLGKIQPPGIQSLSEASSRQVFMLLWDLSLQAYLTHTDLAELSTQSHSHSTPRNPFHPSLCPVSELSGHDFSFGPSELHFPP